MTREEFVSRARRMIGKGCRYQLGKGGMTSMSAAPWPTRGGCSADKLCDCSGFVAWAAGVSRWLKGTPYATNYEWFETSNIFRDAQSPWGFVNIAPAQVGSILVYGDVGGKQGHIGIVSDPMLRRVIHCSLGNFRRTGDAIQETGFDVFGGMGKRIFADLKWIE